MEIREVSRLDAMFIINKFHYSKVLPKLNKLFIGGFINGKQIAVMTLGWGVQPKATIKKIFPSLDTKDYFEIGKLCLDECMPRNSESEFISKCLNYIKINYPKIKIIYTWSDGMLGKAGFVYQASNFLYGGFIWTDSYFTIEGYKIHPRSTKDLCKLDAKMQNKKKVFWLSNEFQNRNGIIRYKGMQLRYCYFLCSKKEKKLLLKNSSYKWGINYPKINDLKWKKKEEGIYIFCSKPFYKSSLNAREVSRAIHLVSNQKGLVQFQYLAPFLQTKLLSKTI